MNTYYLHNARCFFRFTNDTARRYGRVQVRRHVLTDSADLITQSCDIRVELVRETCSWLNQAISSGSPVPCTSRATGVNRYIQAGDLQKVQERLDRIQRDQRRIRRLRRHVSVESAVGRRQSAVAGRNEIFVILAAGILTTFFCNLQSAFCNLHSADCPTAKFFTGAIMYKVAVIGSTGRGNYGHGWMLFGNPRQVARWWLWRTITQAA